MAGPWQGARWWRAEGAGAPSDDLESAEEVATWQRMVHWGLVPDEVHAMLAFAGVSNAARRRIANQAAKAMRAAASQAVWHGRTEHDKAEGATAQGRAEQGDRQESDDSEEEGRAATAGSEEEGRGQMEGGIAGEDGTRRSQNQAEAARTQARASKKRSQRAAAAHQAALQAASEAPSQAGQEAVGGHMQFAGPTGSQLAQEKVLAAMAVSLASGTIGGQEKTWRALDGWWTDLAPAQRFPGLVCRAGDGACEAQTAGGERCVQPGHRRGAEVACRDCRYAKAGARGRQEDCHQEGQQRKCRRMHCRLCGVAGGAGSEELWGGIGRWTVVCSDCADGMQVVPEEMWCAACGATNCKRGALSS